MNNRLLFKSIFAEILLSLAITLSAQAVTPPATTCILSTFSRTGNIYSSTISLTLTNKCGTVIDLQNSTVTFDTATSLNTNFWITSNTTAYPSNTLEITSQALGKNNFLASLSLQFPVASWSKTTLENGAQFIIQYVNPTADYVNTSGQVYLNTTPPVVQTGEIDLTSATAQPARISQAFAVVDLVSSGQVVSKVNLPWMGTQHITGLAVGSYTVQPETITDTNGNIYQGAAAPSGVSVVANAKVASAVSYTEMTNFGGINIQVPALPSGLTGYTQVPVVTLTRPDTGATTTSSLAWNTTTEVSKLANTVTYNLTTPVIHFNSFACTGTFTPASVVSTVTPATAVLSYSCVQSVTQDTVAVNVSGVPSTTSSVSVTFTPSNGSAAVVKAIPLANGSGNTSVSLVDGMSYSASTTSVSGFTTTLSAQTLVASANAVESIVYSTNVTPTGGGRIIGYLPGWLTPPTAASLAAAGYTHILVAFGVFSTTQPGQIVSAFSTVSQAYIASLHAAGIKVLLSLGGASTSIASTSVDFHSVLSSATSPAAFQQAFVTSAQSFITQYGFDGFDFDIEQGFNGTGTFTNPTGDIQVLAAIINQLHASNPSLLLTLVPQAANVSATSGFDNTFGNYSSLIMQTHAALTWVGVQLYNTGCVFGIDQVCYANDASTSTTPNFSTALAVDLLANWPATDSTGRATGFQPYISFLTPSQVVLGYPAPDNTGASDGSPVTPIATIKNAINCLTTKKACGTFIPPKTYPAFGGVFNWEVIHDQANGFAFANGLKACVLTGNCQ